jgi:hypothetical protein
VGLDTICPDCGGAISVAVKNGKIESENPNGLIGYVDLPFSRWMKDIPFT